MIGLSLSIPSVRFLMLGPIIHLFFTSYLFNRLILDENYHISSSVSSYLSHLTMIQLQKMVYLFVMALYTIFFIIYRVLKNIDKSCPH